jgi:HEAT repeat protein
MSAPPPLPLGGEPPAPDEEHRYRAVLAVDPAASDGVAALLERLDDPSWRVRRAAGDRIAQADPRRAVPPLVAALAPGASAGRRTAAAAALVQIGGGALPALTEALSASAPELRTAAVEILGDVGDRAAVGPVTARLGDRDANTRVAAAEALGKIGGPGAIAALDAALAGEETAVRRAALDALGRLRAPPCAARLAELARDRALRRGVLKLAGASDEPGAIALLAGALADPSRTVREAALAGVGQQRLRGAAGGALEAALSLVAREAPDAVAAAAAALEDGDVAVRAGALALIAASGDARHAPALARAAEDERLCALAADALAALGPGLGDALAADLGGLAPAARAAALSAMARLGDVRVLPELVAALASEDDAVRAPAIGALARLGDPAAAEALSALLEHPEPSVSGAAVLALAALAGRGEAARARVLGACRVRVDSPALFRLLGHVGGLEDVPAVDAGLKARLPSSRAAAAGALAAMARRLRVPRCAPELLDALDDGDAAVRAAAAEAVGALAAAAGAGAAGWSEALRGVAASLHDVEPGVRSAAAEALGCCRAVEYRPAVAALACDPAAPAIAAAAAVHALAEMGDPDADVLARAARHPDPEVVKEAVAAAARVPGPAGAGLLLAAAAHPRWDVRRAAAEALGERGDGALLDSVRRLARSEEDALVAEALASAARRLEACGPS